jgi:peptide/nickel transport system permease protein
MYKYVFRRLMLAVPVLLMSSLIVFGLMRVMPGDALTALMAESGNVGEKELKKLRMDLGLDKPYPEQYALWVWQMVSLNPGDSIFTNEPIPVALKKAVPVTLELATLAIILGLVIAIPIGVRSATRQDTAPDYVGRVVAVSGLSLPDFWLGTLVITFAAIWFHWIPPIGYTSLWDSPWRNLQQFLLPAAVLGFRLSAATMRMTRSTVLEVLREDYVRTAWAKGLAGRFVVYKHALKNALIPVVTIMAIQVAGLLSGAVITEAVFGIPGIGRLSVNAIQARDMPLLQGSVLFATALVILGNLVADILYSILDPRVRSHLGKATK